VFIQIFAEQIFAELIFAVEGFSQISRFAKTGFVYS